MSTTVVGDDGLPSDDAGGGVVAQEKSVCAVSPGKAGRTCQFDAEATYVLDGKNWCAFHLPMESASGLPSPKAQWSAEEAQTLLLKPIAKVIADASGGATADLSFLVVPQHAILRLGYSEANQAEDGPILGVSVKFDSATFCGKTFFQFHFGPGTSFHGTRFRERVDFRRSKFFGGAYFFNAEFDDIAQFMSVHFDGATNFSGAVFKEYGDFGNAVFSGTVRFDRATFQGDARFQVTRDLEKRATIEGFSARSAVFRGGATFTNRSFLGSTRFDGAVFHQAPDFHGCSLHQATVFPGLESFKDVTTEGASACYRTLAQAMADLRARDEEALFFSLQQRAARHHMKWYDPVATVSWVYDYASGYGRSIVRPLLLMAATFVVFPLAYAALGRSIAGTFMDALRPAFSFSFQQLFSPFAVWKDPVGWPVGRLAGEAAVWPLILGSLQTVLVLLWLYLLALGIRWRFQRW